ncbi:uncharacterized protein LOC133336935 [Musca vetustissima]|uniref:uncharacterized protein LOC133336935 n=1 Tax=Musca vetustissima TaxID=27455 RepID=UPI002AB6E28A|nr:uncharacterized protein LOC133336935 [Musca vetustissima]
MENLHVHQKVVADDHDWFPKDPAAVQEQCEKENPLSDETKDDMLQGVFHNYSDMTGYITCVAKRMNFYTSENGFDAERLVYVLNKMERLYNRNAVEECVKKYDEITPESEMVYLVSKCVKEENVPKED